MFVKLCNCATRGREAREVSSVSDCVSGVKLGFTFYRYTQSRAKSRLDRVCAVYTPVFSSSDHFTLSSVWLPWSKIQMLILLVEADLDVFAHTTATPGATAYRAATHNFGQTPVSDLKAECNNHKGLKMRGSKTELIECPASYEAGRKAAVVVSSASQYSDGISPEPLLLTLANDGTVGSGSVEDVDGDLS